MNEWKNEIDRNDKNDKKWIIWTTNKIGDEGARMISESLKINTTLTKLDLRRDEIVVKWKQAVQK